VVDDYNGRYRGISQTLLDDLPGEKIL